MLEVKGSRDRLVVARPRANIRQPIRMNQCVVVMCPLGSDLIDPPRARHEALPVGGALSRYFVCHSDTFHQSESA